SGTIIKSPPTTTKATIAKIIPILKIGSDRILLTPDTAKTLSPTGGDINPRVVIKATKTPNHNKSTCNSTIIGNRTGIAIKITAAPSMNINKMNKPIEITIKTSAGYSIIGSNKLINFLGNKESDTNLPNICAPIIINITIPDNLTVSTKDTLKKLKLT